MVRSLVDRPQIRAHGHHVLPQRYAVLDNAALQRALPLDGADVRAQRLDDDEVVGAARRTIGLDPVEVLVLPRALALVLVLPLLTFYTYTWLLRHSVGERLEELRWQHHDADATYAA